MTEATFADWLAARMREGTVVTLIPNALGGEVLLRMQQGDRWAEAFLAPGLLADAPALDSWAWRELEETRRTHLGTDEERARYS